VISQFDDIVTQAIADTGTIPGLNFQDTFALVNAVIQKESSFDPNAQSPNGAGIGLMQVNPAWWGYYVDLTDPYTNVVYGLKVLAQYIGQFGMSGGLGAYFAGPDNRFTQAAKSYAQSVLNFFSNFKNQVMQLFSSTPSSGEYFTSQAGTDMNYDFSNLMSLPEINSVAQSYIDQGNIAPGSSSYLPSPAAVDAYGNPISNEADYTWLYIAAAIVIVLAIIR
jgi:Transglycosylase SLT domain